METLLKVNSQRTSISSAKIVEESFNDHSFIKVSITTATKDYEALQKQYSTSIGLIEKSPQSSHQSLYVSNSFFNDPGVFMQLESPSKLKKIILRKVPSNEKAILLQLYEGDYLKDSFYLFGKESKVFLYTDDFFFQERCWSHDENYIALVAGKEMESTEKAATGEKYLFQEDWGETFTGKPEPKLVIVNLIKRKAEIVGTNFSPAQPIWNPECPGEIFCVGVENLPKKYGIVYCYNRLSSIYRLKFEDEDFGKIKSCDLLSKVGDSCRSLRYCDGRKSLFYLANPVGGSHNQSSRLYEYVISSALNSVVIDYNKGCENGYSGIYCHQLPQFPFHSNYRYLMLESIFRTDKIILSIKLDSREVQIVKADKGFSWVLCDVKDPYFISYRTSCLGEYELEVGEIYERKVNSIEFSLREETRLLSIAKDLKVEIVSPEHDDLIDIILLTPASEKRDKGPLPLVIYPHGGPNSVFTTEFMLYPIALALRGFAVALTNYTGSIGYGNDRIEKLEGRIGSLDVEDVHKCALCVIEMMPGEIDQGKVFVIGGSHGGFIGAWLSASYPDFYRGVVLRNPVLDLASNLALSDIPDWSFSQAGLIYDMKKFRFPEASEYASMREMSPMSKVEMVKCPTLLLLGNRDRRVPNYQAINWHHSLISNGKESFIYTFPEVGHAMDSVEAEKFAFEIISSFLEKRLVDQ